MNMISFYILQGHSHDTLINLSFCEKQLYMAAMERYYKEMSSLYGK